jgi:large subunit ribosomal protein L13
LHPLYSEEFKDYNVNTLSYRTVSANKQTVSRDWILIDAENQVVGRLAAKIANLVRGKHKPYFTPHVDCGDKVVVINADKIRFTGKKMSDKVYLHYTGYPGGQRSITPDKLMAKKPEEVLTLAVRGMLPGNKLRKEFLKNLFIYAGSEHPHQAQNPKSLEL